jgi:hypothetical protein
MPKGDGFAWESAQGTVGDQMTIPAQNLFDQVDDIGVVDEGFKLGTLFKHFWPPYFLHAVKIGFRAMFGESALHAGLECGDFVGRQHVGEDEETIAFILGH